MTRLSPLFTWRSAVADGGSRLSPDARLVALVLSLHMSEKGDSAYPPLVDQADETGLNKRQVAKAHRELESGGWLEVVREGPGRGRANEYRSRVPTWFVPASEWKELSAGEMEHRKKGSTPAPFLDPEKVPDGQLKGAEKVQNPPYLVPQDVKDVRTKDVGPTKSSLTADWTPDALLVQWAKETYPAGDLTHEVAQFVDHHLAKGSKMVDWRRAFQMWIRNSVKWNGAGRQRAAVRDIEYPQL